MNTAEAMAVMRSIDPLWREGMTVEEFEEETRDVARVDLRHDLRRQAGWRPLYEQPIDHATARRRAQCAARNRKYRRNKRAKKDLSVTQPGIPLITDQSNKITSCAVPVPTQATQ